jgi:hypothetical protein
MTGVPSQSGEKVNKTSISTNNWAQWHVPVIPATREAEIRRTAVPSQPRQKKVHETPSQ